MAAKKSGFLSARFLSGVVIGLIMVTIAGIAFNQSNEATNRVLEALGLPTISAENPFDGNGAAPNGSKNAGTGESGTSTSPTEISIPGIEAITERDLYGLTVTRSDISTAAIGSSGYDRLSQFGSWSDPDGNGCDARNDILARDLDQVTKEGSCTVTSGILDDPYTGKTIAFTRGVGTSAAVQIDHIVPLGHAWVAGADSWPQEKRVAFANDPINLIAVDGPANGAKGARAADEWMPENTDSHCSYARAQVLVKKTYDLPVSSAERSALKRALGTC